jgi:glutamine synthetase
MSHSTPHVTEARGMLDLDTLKHMVAGERIETVIVAFTDHLGRLMGKRFDAQFFVDEIHAHGTHGCNYLLTVDMEMTPVPGYKFANWELGYGDFHIVPDLSTLRLASWLDKTALVLCDVKEEKTHSLVSVAPRTMLRKQLERATAMGFITIAASELEYYIYEDSYRAAGEKGYDKLTPMGWYLEDYHVLQGTREEKFTALARHHLARSGIPVENSKGEFGLGQHELNVRYADVLTMADRHCIFKHAMKEIAEQCGASVTFMAKPFSGQAGSSAHIHLSLWRGNANAFASEKESDTLKVSDSSDVFRCFLGGWIAHAREMMVFYAPTVNSYKRYEDGSWAPTRLAWSHDNRTAGFRVVGHGNSLRIECRIPGADCNPYLAYAAALASGLDGIENKIEPPSIFVGDVYAAQNLPRVPYTLHEATDAFESSEWAKRTLGEDVHEHYAHYFRVEQRAFDTAVTDWERKRYFERI